MTKLTPALIEVILAFAENDMGVRRTAQALYRSPGGLWYPFKKIREATGLDPQKFYDLILLVQMCEEGKADVYENEAPGTPAPGSDANREGTCG